MTDKQRLHTPEFNEVLNFCIERQLYLGEGNPVSDILIVGKECAISDEEFTSKIATHEIDSKYLLNGIEGDKRYRFKETATTELNLNRWSKVIADKISQDQLKDQLNQHVNYTNEYYPVFPHIGQRYQQRKKNGKIGEAGTSPTWYSYQTLVDKIVNAQKNKTDLIDFHLNCFHSELSQIPLPMSVLPKKSAHLRVESIRSRGELFRQPFFRKFPIVILAIGHYPRDYHFDIQEIFDVVYVERKELSSGNWCNIHYGKTTDGRNKILIHTRQVSCGVSNDLLAEIAHICASFYHKEK